MDRGLRRSRVTRVVALSPETMQKLGVTESASHGGHRCFAAGSSYTTNVAYGT